MAAQSVAPTAQASAHARGDRVGPWQLTAPLASGGGGNVWLAVDPLHPADRVVVKFATSGCAAALFAEWQALHAIPSAALPEAVWAVAAPDGLQLLVMRVQPGLPLDVALPGATARQVASALHAALQTLAIIDACAIVHGDLHPGNVLVQLASSGPLADVSLIDLGLACRAGDIPTGVGAVGFAAPERLRGSAADPRDDLFSLAAAFWQAWLGAPPWPNYPAATPPAGARPVAVVPAGADTAAVVDVLAAMLAPERSHRPQSAQAAAARLERALPQAVDPQQQWAHRLRAATQRAAQWSGPAVAIPDVGALHWWLGAAGSGKSALLRGWLTQCCAAQTAVAWLSPDGHSGATLVVGAQGHPWSSLAATETAVLSDAPAQAVFSAAEWLMSALPPGRGVLLVDDAELLPEALRGVVAQWGQSHLPASGWQVLACTAAPTADALELPAVTPTEVGAWLAAATGGRGWDGAVVAALAAAIGQNRAALGSLAATLLAKHVVTVGADAVAVPAAERAGSAPGWQEILAHAVAERAKWALPPAPLWPLLAWCAVGGCAEIGGQLPALGADWPAAPIGATADAATALLHRRGSQFVLADAACRQWCARALPPTLIAAAWREQARRAGDPTGRAVADMTAWVADGAHRPAGETVGMAVRALLDRGQFSAAAEFAGPWVGAADLTQSDSWAATAGLAIALSAAGDQASAQRWLDALPPAARQSREVTLALAEAAFRAGQYAQCRAVCGAWLQQAPNDLAVLIWLGFAATWHGDRDGAQQAIGRCEALLSHATVQQVGLIRYLVGLHHYYAGRVGEAKAAFTAILGNAHGVLRAAVIGGLGLVAHRKGELAAARQHYADAGELAAALGDRLRAINMTMNMAVVDHEAGEPGRALQAYGRVIVLGLAAGNPGAVARAQTNRGNLLASLGLGHPARSDLDAALAFWQAAGNRHLEGNVCCVLGELAAADGQLAIASQHLAQADDALLQAGAVTERAEIQLAQATLFAIGGDAAAALALTDIIKQGVTAQAMPELHGRIATLRAAIALDRHPWQLAEADAIARALDDSQLALELLPTTKPVYRAQASALRVRALMASGHAAQAKDLATDQLGVLDRVSATLDDADRHSFDHAATLRSARLVLRTVADARFAGVAQSDGSRTALLNSVLAINRRLGVQHDLATLLDSVMDAAVLLTGAERGFLLIDDGEPTDPIAQRAARLRVAVARNVDRENLRRPAHKLSHTVAESVFVNGEAVLSTDAQQDQRFAQHASVHSGSLRSILCVPLPAPDGVIGVVYVDNRFAAGAFSADHGVLLAALADQAAIAIQTARTVHRQRMTAAALEQSRAEVEQLNGQLRAQLDDVSHQLDGARADLQAQRLAIVRRSDYSQIKGESPAIMRLFGLMDRVRDHAFAVLVHGESGTGKELVARAIHFTGTRSNGPFVAINCGALPSNLLESELFGHTKGAFTGAVADRRGLFEAADGGTLLLDEVGEMPLEMQVKLLRVLQTGEFTRVGESTPRRTDARVVAATHRDLSALVRTGAFREDLLYRLRVVELEIPPLRQRPTDIAELVDYFLAQNRQARLGKVTAISRQALAMLCQAPWPGNVRQLEMLLKSACLFADSDTLGAADIEPLLQRERPVAQHPSGPAAAVGAGLDHLELEAAVQAIVAQRVARFAGNKRQAALSLGIDRGTLYAKLRQGGAPRP